MHQAGKVAEDTIMSYMLQGIFDKYTGYNLIPQYTECGTLYYIVSYY